MTLREYSSAGTSGCPVWQRPRSLKSRERQENGEGCGRWSEHPKTSSSLRSSERLRDGAGWRCEWYCACVVSTRPRVFAKSHTRTHTNLKHTRVYSLLYATPNFDWQFGSGPDVVHPFPGSCVSCVMCGREYGREEEEEEEESGESACCLPASVL